MAGETTMENPISKKQKINEDDDHHRSDQDDNDEEDSGSVDSYGFFSYNGYTSNDYSEEETTKTDPQQSEITEPDLPNSTGIISKLPIEVFHDILSRVPLKTLSNCRFVNKSWYNSIKNPNFIKLHHKKVLQSISFSLIYHDITHPGEFSLINHENLESFDTEIVVYKAKLPRPLLVGMDSCNGLVCSRGKPYFVCNPVTGEHMVIPKPPLWDVEDVVNGFGYDTVKEVFKFVRVIKVVENAEKCVTVAQLYNFSTGKWRLIPEVPYVFKDKENEESNVCVNGALHWLGCPVDKSGDSESIISFRFDSEEFKQLLLPIPTSDRDCFGFRGTVRRFDQYLVVLGEFLCVVHEFRQEEIEVWIMKKYGLQSSWVKEYSIKDVTGSLDIYIEGELETGPYKPLQLMKNGKILMLCSHHSLGYYDPYDGTLASIYTGTGDYVDSALQPVLHMGSLISPNSIGKLCKSKKLDVNKEDDGNDIDVEDTEFGDDEVTEFDDDDDEEDYLDYDGYTSNEYDIDATGTELGEVEESEVSKMSVFLSKLPIEVFFEILSRVPLKSLSSCRWVSKAWFDAIKSPRFIQMHHNKVIQNKSFCVLSYDSYDEGFSLFSNENLEAFETHTVCYTPKLPRSFVEMDSCNGLVCSREQPYFVCNPITGEHMVIPKPPLYDKEDTVTGFGFDPVTKVFKFLRIMEDAENHLSRATIAQLYNFSTGKWRLIPEVPFVFKNTKSNVCVNGALHWLGYPIDKSMDSKIIVSFNFDSEQFQQVPMPIPTSPSSDHNRFSFRRTPRRFDQYLVVLGEFLCIVREFHKEEIEVWVMREYGLQSSWVKEYSIKDVTGSLDIYMEGELETGPYKPLQLMKNGKLLMLCSHHNLGYYDPYEGSFEYIYTDSGTYADSVLHPLIHVGSLISPRSIGKLRKRYLSGLLDVL